jgi:hypothetical protein
LKLSILTFIFLTEPVPFLPAPSKLGQMRDVLSIEDPRLYGCPEDVQGASSTMTQKAPKLKSLRRGIHGTETGKTLFCEIYLD